MLSRCASTAAIPCLSTHPHSSTDLRGDRLASPPLPHQVRVGNTVATRLPPFQLVGEASLLENLQSPGGTLQPAARATIVAMPGAKYVRWSQRTFYELQEHTHHVSPISIYSSRADARLRLLSSCRRSTRGPYMLHPPSYHTLCSASLPSTSRRRKRRTSPKRCKS